MLLAIDIGNTNTVFAVYDGDTFIDCWRIRSDVGRSADEYASFLNELFRIANIQWTDIRQVVVSSVVPEANFTMRRFCEKYVGHDPVFVGRDVVGIACDIDRPDDIGADRLVNAVAVNAEYSAPAIVIDFGTATTFDVVDSEGKYAGGVIAPGINLSMAALHQAASKLPKVGVKKPEKALGKNTVTAMQSGIYWGYMGLIDRIVGELKTEIGDSVTVIATGGLAPLFAKDNSTIDVVDENLTLKGLHLIANQKGLV